jgi:hypothetical protein
MYLSYLILFVGMACFSYSTYDPSILENASDAISNDSLNNTNQDTISTDDTNNIPLSDSEVKGSYSPSRAEEDIMWFFKTLFCSDIDVPNMENKINELEATNNSSDNPSAQVANVSSDSPSAQVVDVPSDNPSVQVLNVPSDNPSAPVVYVPSDNPSAQVIDVPSDNLKTDFHSLKHSPSTEHIASAFVDSLPSTDMDSSINQQNPIKYTLKLESVLGTVGPTEGTFEHHSDGSSDTSTEPTSYAERTHEHDITSDEEYSAYDSYNEGYYEEEVDPDIIRQAQEEVSRMLAESKLNK